MNDNLVTVDSVSKVFTENTIALDSISFNIPKGIIVGLAGPDGAGKTTLIRLIAGLLIPTTGTIKVCGYNTVTQQNDVLLNIGYMPQKFGLYEDLTVEQNLNLYADLKSIPNSERNEKIEKLLNFTNLKKFTNRLAGALSGGMKQKLGIACALIKKPSLLLLDEPSVGVDPLSRRELWLMVQDLIDEGISVIWSTSYLDEAEKCDSVLLLNEGKLLYNGNPADLTNQVKEQTFKISNIKGSRRSYLEYILDQESIIDGIIQGSDIRITTKKNADLPSLIEGSKIEKTTPRFEDAFVDILGGVKHGKSKLAEQIPFIQTSNETIIEADHLTKKYGQFTAADQITFKINQGEIFGLLGPNGAGKTTVFKMMCGLVAPTSGKASVDGYDLQVAPGIARSHLGYMAQKFSLYGNLSVMQNLQFFSGIYGLSGKKQKNAINQVVDVFGFDKYLNTTSDTLPLGFKQRLALSCAIMHKPKVLFLDEPTSGVDPLTRREFWGHIYGLVEKGVTIMVTTHFMDEAEYCDRIALVYQSKLIKLGTPEELKESAVTKDSPNPTLEDAFIKLITEKNV